MLISKGRGERWKTILLNWAFIVINVKPSLFLLTEREEGEKEDT